MTLFFRQPKTAGHAKPQHQAATMPVNVTATLREPVVGALAYEPDAAMARHIRQCLPNAKAQSLDLQAALAIPVIRQHADFMAPGSDVPPPDRDSLLAAYRSLEQFVFERVVIA